MSFETNVANRMYLANLIAMHGTPRGEDLSVYPLLRELDDDDFVPGEFAVPTDDVTLVTLDDKDQLLMALSIASERLGLYNDHAAMAEKVQHEDEHARAAIALGLIATHAVRFKRLASGNVGMKTTTLPSGSGITKLGFASIVAHPHRLSNGDQRKITILGYNGVEDVATRIRSTNMDIPLPLSVQ